MELFNIPPTFLPDFLLPENNDVEEEFVFFSVICICSQPKLATIADYFKLSVPCYWLWWVEEQFQMTSSTFEWLTNLLAPNELIRLVGCPLNKDNRYCRCECLGPGKPRGLPSDIWSHSSCVPPRFERTEQPYFMSRSSLARTSSLSSQSLHAPFIHRTVQPSQIWQMVSALSYPPN